MRRLRHTGSVFTTSTALVSFAEIPATPTSPPLPVVIKTYLRSDVEKHNLSAWLQAERTALVRLSSDQSGLIVRLLSAKVSPTSFTFIMARAPGVPAASLSRPIPSSRVAHITTQLVSAIRRVHAAGIIHADLTLRNVIIDINNSDTVCLVDFSAAVVKGEPSRDFSRTTCPHVLAPELLQPCVPDPTVDIWALGVFVWAMLFGGPGPLGSDSNPGVLRRIEKITATGFDVSTAFNNAAHQAAVKSTPHLQHAKSFIAVCLSLDPSNRFTNPNISHSAQPSWPEIVDYERILSHPFLVKQE